MELLSTCIGRDLEPTLLVRQYVCTWFTCFISNSTSSGILEWIKWAPDSHSSVPVVPRLYNNLVQDKGWSHWLFREWPWSTLCLCPAPSEEELGGTMQARSEKVEMVMALNRTIAQKQSAAAAQPSQ